MGKARVAKRAVPFAVVLVLLGCLELAARPVDASGETSVSAAATPCSGDGCSDQDWEAWPLQRKATCSGSATLVADSSFERFRWFRGEVASGVENDPFGAGAVPVHRPIELTEWRNCPAARLGPGAWYVLMEKDYTDADGLLKHRRVLRPFQVEKLKAPSFKIEGIPKGQIPYGSALEVTLDVDGVEGYKGYFVKSRELDEESTPPALQAAEDRPWAPILSIGEKGAACRAFEAAGHGAPESKVPAARQRLKRAEKVASNLRDELARLDSKIAGLRVELSTASSRRQKEIKEQIGRLAGQVLDLEGELMRAELEVETAELHLDRAESILNEILRAEQDLLRAEERARLATTTADREIAEAEARSLGAEIARFRAALAPLASASSKSRDLDKSTEFQEVPFDDTEYTVTVVDGRGCEAKETFKVGVRRYRVDFFFGTEYSTYRGGRIADQEPGMADPSDASPADGSTTGDPPADPMMDDPSDGEAFGDPVVFGGAIFEHAFSRKFSGFGEIRLGAINVETSSAPASSGDVESVIRDADAASFHFGFRVAFLEKLCLDEKGDPRREESEEGWIRKLLCQAQAGKQVKLDLVGRWGFSILTQDEERIRDDFFDDWTVGVAFRNDNPGGLLDGSYFQIGYGRSDNFRRNMDRFKLDGAMVLELPGTKWDLHLAGAFDADRSLDADDLRFTIGFRRDMTELFPVLFGTEDEGES